MMIDCKSISKIWRNFILLFRIFAIFFEIIPELSNKQANPLIMSGHAVISLFVNIILLPKLISSEYHLPFHFSH